MFINNFFKRVILLASEFFDVAVMRRPDHKFRDQWRKADSALQPPSSSYFGHIFWLLVLLLSSFSLQKWPITFKIYRYIYLLNISLCVYYHDFRSVIVFLLQLYKLYLYLCIFHVYLHLHLFFILGQIAVHCTCLSGSHRSWVNWRGNLFYPKHNLVMKSINKQYLMQRREERRNMNLCLNLDIRSQTL